MKTSWDPIEDKWGIGQEGYYLVGRGARLGWVTRFPRQRAARSAFWSAGRYRDDKEPRWLGDFETREAAMQAVEATVEPATGQTAAPS